MIRGQGPGPKLLRRLRSAFELVVAFQTLLVCLWFVGILFQRVSLCKLLSDVVECFVLAFPSHKMGRRYELFVMVVWTSYWKDLLLLLLR